MAQSSRFSLSGFMSAFGGKADSNHHIALRQLMTLAVSKQRLMVLVSVAPCAKGLAGRFCRCFALFFLCVAGFAVYRQFDAANGSTKASFRPPWPAP
jgi:hypothetical protein